MKSELENAIQLCKDDKPEEAFKILFCLLESNPNDPILNYQAAWTCDYMGRESEAAPYYEKSIENGLSGDDLRGALLGLGSTYRCLGEYSKSLKYFDRGISEFPQDRSFKVFRALTLYNLGNYGKSVSDLLILLLDTTSDKEIKSYEKALRFYSDKLSETWK